MAIFILDLQFCILLYACVSLTGNAPSMELINFLLLYNPLPPLSQRSLSTPLLCYHTDYFNIHLPSLRSPPLSIFVSCSFSLLQDV